MGEFKSIKKKFKVVGLKGNGSYENFNQEVPALAKQLLSRSEELDNHMGIEIALFEPKRESAHLVGDYIVGLMVDERLKEVPAGMELIEIEQRYATARGKTSGIGTLHSKLMEWIEEQEYKRNLESYIVETYHPDEDEEEVRIYLPIY